MDCILRVIQGPDAGLSCRLTPGANLIGRSPKASLRLQASEVSWEHALITRTGDDYVLENLSALGTYAQDAKVTGPVKLRPRDQLRLSQETVLRFEPEGGLPGGLLGRRSLMAVVVLLLMAGGVLMVCNPFAGASRGPDNWDRAYAIIDAWISGQMAGRRLPLETGPLFHEAWRQERAQDYTQSQRLWLRLRLLLESVDDQRGLSRLAADNPEALQNLLSPPQVQASSPSDEEAAAALVQFVARRLAFSTAHVKSSRLM